MSGPWQTPKKKGQPKPQHQRFKRQQVQASDGWTVVTHKPASQSAISRDKDALERAVQRPTSTVQGLDGAKLMSEYKKLEERWWGGEGARKLQDILETRPRDLDVQDAVCIGIGSFSLDWENRWRAMWQLVLFMDVVRTVARPSSLTETPDTNIKLFAQDPAFTDLDIEFLSMLEPSVEALDTGIEERITSDTFVFAPFVDWSLLLPIFLRNRDPSLYVGNKILKDYSTYTPTEEMEKIRGECEEIGSRFLADRQMVQLPDFESHGTALQNLGICWKEAGEPEEASVEKDTKDPVEGLAENLARTALSA